jgi:hypothetical protein
MRRILEIPLQSYKLEINRRNKDNQSKLRQASLNFFRLLKNEERRKCPVTSRHHEHMTIDSLRSRKV